MCKAAMVCESKRASPELAKDVQVGGLGSKRKRKRRERRLAIEAGASHAGAGQEVGNRFHAVECILFSDAAFRHSALMSGEGLHWPGMDIMVSVAGLTR